MTLFVDYAWQHPTPATIKAAGYAGVMRYLSTDPTKNLTGVEAAGLIGAGLSIGLVWETSAQRAGAGSAAGQLDAAAANAQATALHYPAGCPIFFAVDYDADPAAVAGYFFGIKAAGGRPAGVYGSLRICTAMRAAGVPYTWQTAAWSAGAVLKDANLYQRASPTVSHPIPATDENVQIVPFPMWRAPAAPWPPAVVTPPRPPVTPSPATPGHLAPGTRTVRQGDTGADVAYLQRFLGIPADGSFGPITKAAVVRYQKMRGLTVDGIAGPVTWLNILSA